MLVSILIGIHNEEKYILDCLKSIEKQTYTNFEIIIVDDCSKDNSLSIARNFLKTINQPSKIIKNKTNLGLTKSLNKGLKECNGEFIARIDADDVWTKNKLKEQISFMKRNPSYGYTGTNFVNTYEATNKQKEMIMLESDKEIKKYAFKKNPFAHSTLMLRSDLLEKVNGYDNAVKRGQDYDLFMRCLPLTKFHNIQKILCYRLIPQKSISISSQDEQAKQSIRTKLKYIRKYKKSIRNYVYLIEPFFNAYTPKFIKKIKRKLL